MPPWSKVSRRRARCPTPNCSAPRCGPPFAPVGTSPRCSSRTAGVRAPPSTTARSRNWFPGVSAVQASASAPERPSVLPTPQISHPRDCAPPPRRLPRRPEREARSRPSGPLTHQVAAAPNAVAVPPYAVAKARKVALLRAADEAARAEGAAISQVACNYGDSRRSIRVANSDGLLATDEQVKTFFSVLAVAVGDTGMQTGRESVGRTVGFELFDDTDVSDLAPGGRPAGAAQAAGPTGAQRGHAGDHRRRGRRGALPRGLRARARGRPHRQGGVGVRRADRRAGGGTPWSP